MKFQRPANDPSGDDDWQNGWLALEPAELLPQPQAPEHPPVPAEVTPVENGTPSGAPDIVLDDPVMPSPPPDIVLDDPVMPSPPPDIVLDDPVMPSPPPDIVLDDPVMPSSPPDIVLDDPVMPSPPPDIVLDDPEMPSPPPDIVLDDPVDYGDPDIVLDDPVMDGGPETVMPPAVGEDDPLMDCHMGLPPQPPAPLDESFVDGWLDNPELPGGWYACSVSCVTYMVVAEVECTLLVAEVAQPDWLL